MPNASQIISAVLLLLAIAAAAVSLTVHTGRPVEPEGYANFKASTHGLIKGSKNISYMNEESTKNDDIPFFSVSTHPVFHEDVRSNKLVLERDADLQLDLGRSSNKLRTLYNDYTASEDTLDNLKAVISFKKQRIDDIKRSIAERYNDESDAS